MTSPAQRKALRQSPTRPSTTTLELKRATCAALAEAGVVAPFDETESGGDHTLIAGIRDADGAVRLWLVRDDALSEEERSALETASGRCFAPLFVDDLMPSQFAGALFALVRMGELRVGVPGDGILDDIASVFASEGVALPSADWERIFGDGWGSAPLPPGAGLGAVRLTHAYWFHVAV